VILPHSPLRLKIDGDALVSNWRWLARMSGSAACGAAVKADGYGIGARETVLRLAEAGCRDFFVATWAEAEELTPLLAMRPCRFCTASRRRMWSTRRVRGRGPVAEHAAAGAKDGAAWGRGGPAT
jgi:hypothetical protein